MKRFIYPGVLVFFSVVFLFGISLSFGQDQIGDVAREERDRRTDDSTRSYVYTNEDLTQPRIVIRRSSEKTIAAEPAANPVPNEPSPDQNPASPSRIVWPDNVPLGDIARFYRRQRELASTMASTRDSDFATNEPPVLDMDFLLPSPLASPLPDFSQTFSPLPSIAEPNWEPAVASPEASEDTIRVRPGDSLWKIAERYLGRGEDWGIIAAANPDLKNPNQIQAGQMLHLPASEASPISPASLASPSERVVEVQSGDSLWKLASSQMGSGSSWSCLAAANPQIEDVNRIYPGQFLVIPTACPAGV